MNCHARPSGEHYLNPGDIWFGGGRVRLSTLLGSCISVTLWHPSRHLGGMCHFMLPGRKRAGLAGLNAKYADEAFAILDREMARAGTRPSDYQAKIFGGGNMFPHLGSGEGEVGLRNVEMARSLLAERSIEVLAEHVGGRGHRKLFFDVWSGDAWLNFQKLPCRRQGE